MYDEPTAGLDPVASTVVEDLIRSLHVGGRDGGNAAQKAGGISAYIVVTHQHSTIRRAVDRCGNRPCRTFVTVSVRDEMYAADRIRAMNLCLPDVPRQLYVTA